MKKKVEMKKDEKEFERFDALLGQVVNVPKDEILKRGKAEKESKEKAKKS